MAIRSLHGSANVVNQTRGVEWPIVDEIAQATSSTKVPLKPHDSLGMIADLNRSGEHYGRALSMWEDEGGSIISSSAPAT